MKKYLLKNTILFARVKKNDNAPFITLRDERGFFQTTTLI